MAALHVYKFTNIAELEHWLDGGIIGGSPVPTGFGSSYNDLVGKTATFTTPSAFVTFTIGADTIGGSLTFKEVRDQIEAAITGVKVLQINGRLALVESNPTNGVDIGSASAEVARALLGFDGAAGGHCKNVKKNPMVGASPTAPYLVQVVTPGNDIYIAIVQE